MTENTSERAHNQRERHISTKNAIRHADEVKNPCLREQKLSYKCLSDHDYDREQCSKYFLNYKNCKEFWSFITRQRRRNGIKPALPPLEERDQIRKDNLGWNTE